MLVRRTQITSVRRCARLLALVAALSLAASCADAGRDPRNELPFGVVDAPRPGDVVPPGRILVGGWAMDDSAVDEILVYLDSHFAASTTLNVARPDVAKAFPQYARSSDVHGWNVRIEVPNSPGAHTIIVQAVDDHGATRDLGTVTITIPK